MKPLKKVLELLSGRERRRLGLVLVIVVVGAFVEIAGVGSIGPFMSVVSNPETVAQSDILSWLYQTGGFETTQAFVVFLGIGVIVLFTISSLYTAFALYAVHRFSLMRSFSLSQRLMWKYLSQPYPFFLGKNSSELSKNVLQEVSQVVDGIMNPLLRGVARGLAAIAIAGYLVWTDPVAAIWIVGILGAGFASVYVIIRARLITLGESRVESNRQRFKAVTEAFAAIKESRIMGLESRFAARYSRAARAYARVQVKTQVLTVLPRHLIEPLAIASIIVLVLVMVVRAGDITAALPVLSIYALGGMRMMPAVQIAFLGISKARNSMPSADLLHFDMFHDGYARTIALDFANPRASRDRLPFNDEFALRNVEFSYDSSKIPAIRTLSVAIKKNSIVGFVGPTGCGKTTIIDVILGLLEPQSGILAIDGAEITPDQIHAWQHNFGYVPQHIYLTDDTICRNIAFGLGDDEIDRTRVTEVAKIANIHNFVSNDLPEGYDTVVGDRGVRLSGGERQRIGIARALYRDPSILILDEATSSLDSVTERAVMDAIDNLMHQKTIIMIAHRLNTVRKCDVVNVMKDGQIVARGNYKDLLETNSDFQRLAAT